VSCSNLVSQAKLWIETFPQYAYPVIIILGLIVLSVLYSCVKGCCCGKKNNQRALTRPAYPRSAPVQPAYGIPTGNGNRASGNSTTSQAELNRLNRGIYPEADTNQVNLAPAGRQQLSKEQLKTLSGEFKPQPPPKIVNY
jgi:hypothetical protein